MPESCALSEKSCSACTPITPKLKWPSIKRLLAEVPHWRYEVSPVATTIARHFRFEKFAKAIDFVNKVAAIAETEGHHPDIKIENFNQVTLSLTTHAIDGLSENDFIMAAKIDTIA